MFAVYPEADMARKKDSSITDLRHPESERTNNPPAGLAADGHVPILPKQEYAYSPRRPPVLRFDPSGGPDQQS